MAAYPVTRTVAQAVRERKSADPSLSNREIARQLGISTSAVWRARNPDRVREANAQRREYKRAWENQRMRDHRSRCDICGGLCGIGSGKDPAQTCIACVRSIAETKDS